MSATTASPPKAAIVRRPGDSIFSASALGAGLLILVALAGVAIFLIAQSLPAFGVSKADLNNGFSSFWTYVAPLVFGTIWAAFLALVIALPFSIGIALFISHYAPRRIARPLGTIVDLLAAVPSVVYGLWGSLVLAPFVQPFYTLLTQALGWFPPFQGPASGTGRTILTAAVVLAVMIIPIITALSREIFLQTPRLNEEAALALGSTRWEMIRLAVLPYGRAGIVSASMLGLGRALGETLAVAMVLSPSLVISFFLLKSTANPTTIAANIALQFPDSFGIGVNVLMATGLILFILTFVVNAIARAIVGAKGAGRGA